MSIIKNALGALTKEERIWFFALGITCLVASAALLISHIKEKSVFIPIHGGIYREGTIGQPSIINPVLSGNTVDRDISTLVFSKLGDVTSSFHTEEEGRVYVVNLKEGVLWDNGAPLTTDDVVFTIQTIQNPESRSPLFNNWQGVGVERISELQIRFALPVPYSFFIENINNVPVIPKHVFGNIPSSNLALSSYNLEPIGSGPFKFGGFSQKKDGFITEYKLVRNEKYFGDSPYIDSFVFKFYKNTEEVGNAVRMREIDGFGTLDPGEIKELSLPSRMKKTEIPMQRMYGVFLNPANKLIFSSREIREALSLSLPKNLIKDIVSLESVYVVHGPYGNIHNENSRFIIPYDPSLANSIIEKRGERIEFTLIAPNIGFLKKTAELLKESWEKAGISRVTVLYLSSEEITNSVIKTNNYDALLFGYVLENSNDLFPFWHSSQRIYPGLNLSLYKNERVDSLIEGLRETLDKDRQKEISKMIEAAIMQDAPAVFLFSLPYTYIHTKNLGGFYYGETERNESIVLPSSRFMRIEKWFVKQARVLK